MKVTLYSPFAIREIALQIEKVLGLNLGIPMNAEITNVPTASGEEHLGTYTIHWECGWHCSGHALVGIYESMNGDYQAVRLVSLRFRRPFHGHKPMVRRNGEIISPLPTSTMTVFEKIGAGMEYTGDRFALQLDEEQLGDIRHFAERYPEVKLG